MSEKLYVLATEDNIGTNAVYGIFSSAIKAEEAKQHLVTAQIGELYDYDLYEFALDEFPDWVKEDIAKNEKWRNTKPGQRREYARQALETDDLNADER